MSSDTRYINSSRTINQSKKGQTYQQKTASPAKNPKMNKKPVPPREDAVTPKGNQRRKNIPKNGLQESESGLKQMLMGKQQPSPAASPEEAQKMRAKPAVARGSPSVAAKGSRTPAVKRPQAQQPVSTPATPVATPVASRAAPQFCTPQTMAPPAVVTPPYPVPVGIPYGSMQMQQIPVQVHHMPPMPHMHQPLQPGLFPVDQNMLRPVGLGPPMGHPMHQPVQYQPHYYPYQPPSAQATQVQLVNQPKTNKGGYAGSSFDNAPNISSLPKPSFV